jgi:hypothetical protein
LEERVAAPVKKTETNDRGGSVALTTQHPLSAKVGTTSPTSGGRSVGIVRSRTKATEFDALKNQPLLRNGSINTLPRNQIHHPFLGKRGSATAVTSLNNEAYCGTNRNVT